jgi:3-oxoadipate enol-lactonase
VISTHPDRAGLHYRVEGRFSAPAVVLCHSLGTDLYMWDAQVAALSSRYCVVRFDSRGHGASEAPPGPYTLDALGGDLIGLLDALDIARAHVCGVSLGGLVALWLAVHHPGRVDRLVCANTAAKMGDADLWTRRVEAVQSGGMAAIRDEVMARFFSEAFRQRRPDIVEWFARTLESTPVHGYVGSCLALREADLRAAVHAITAPALIVAGAYDLAAPRAEAERLQAEIAGSDLRVLETAHLSNVEDPDRFNEAVLAFLGTA